MSSISGTILKCVAGFYYVLSKNGRIYECRACGKLRKDKIKPLAGDHVYFTLVGDDKGNIEQIKNRKNSLVRPPVANVDKLAIIISATVPAVDFMLCDKLLAQAEFSNITPFICINKAEEGEDMVEQISAQYKYYKTIPVSAVTGDGIDILKDQIKNCCVCFTGQSAVGKSSLINALEINKNLEIGALSKKTERGKHTTRVTELLFISKFNAFVFDTPGFSSLEISLNTRVEAQMYYPEFNQFKNECKYASCIHLSEPICGIKRAVDNGKISKERYMRYLNVLDSLNRERK